MLDPKATNGPDGQSEYFRNNTYIDSLDRGNQEPIIAAATWPDAMRRSATPKNWLTRSIGRLGSARLRNWQNLYSSTSLRQQWRKSEPLLRRMAKYAGFAFAIWFAAMLVLIIALRFVNPPTSALMLIRLASGTDIKQTWVPLRSISPNLVRAVVVSEDWRFCQHWGIDLREIEAAIRRAKRGVPRGASTISMQVAKNMFLWPSKSYFRKLLEVPLTLAIELFWPKRRIIEVYLNIAEWGRGIFGARAAARHHFRTVPKWLGRHQAALLAVSLPNPLRRRAGRPTRRMQAMARTVEQRMYAGGRRATTCIFRP